MTQVRKTSVGRKFLHIPCQCLKVWWQVQPFPLQDLQTSVYGMIPIASLSVSSVYSDFALQMSRICSRRRFQMRMTPRVNSRRVETGLMCQTRLVRSERSEELGRSKARCSDRGNRRPEFCDRQMRTTGITEDSKSPG